MCTTDSALRNAKQKTEALSIMKGEIYIINCEPANELEDLAAVLSTSSFGVLSEFRTKFYVHSFSTTFL